MPLASPPLYLLDALFRMPNAKKINTVKIRSGNNFIRISYRYYCHSSRTFVELSNEEHEEVYDLEESAVRLLVWITGWPFSDQILKYWKILTLHMFKESSV